VSVPSLRLRQNVEWIECETIRQALRMSTAKRQAASLMGISPRALSHYLAKYGFSRPQHGVSSPAGPSWLKDPSAAHQGS